MTSVRYKSFEFFILYILFPVGLVTAIPLWFKISYCLLGFIYLLFMLLKIEKVGLVFSDKMSWSSFWRETFYKFLVISIITWGYVYFTNKDLLFQVVLNKPKLWILILFVYSLFSVYPQELIFRTFYFKRYVNLILNKNLFIFLNAVVFSLAHLVFNNVLVSVLTFLGGLIFAKTFQKSESTILVSIEHAIYGGWLFTVGMGEMLGFPV